MVADAWSLLALRGARALNLTAALSLFGTLVVALAVARGLALPAAAEARLRAVLRRLLRASGWVQFVSAGLFLMAQALRMTEPERAGDAVGAVAFVATGSTFGQALLARTLLFATAIWIAADLARTPRLWAALALAAGALALQAQLGHAAAAEGWVQPLALGLHVLAAGAWLGGLLPLALTLREASGAAALRAARRFSRVGLFCVTLLIATAAVQGWEMIGGPGGWFGTDYGRTALAKGAGFLILLGFAALNRLLLTPRLVTAGGRRALLASIVLEAVIGLAVVVAAAGLATLPPGVHEQPVWPFPQRPDFASLSQAYVQREVIRALLVAGLVGLGVAALFWRRTRLIGPVAAVVVLWVWQPQPNLRLLLMPAVPTSYQTTLTGYTPAAIARGAELVRAMCTAECFRSKDDPSDLTPYGLWRRGDGDLIWWLTAVFDRIGHSPFPYGTIAALDERTRWQLIDYFRARVAGRAARTRGVWGEPMSPPDLPVRCGGETRQLSDLRGHLVRIVPRGGAGPVTARRAPEGVEIITLRIDRAGDDHAAGEDAAAGLCHAGSPDIWTAFSLISGVSEADLSGTEILLDANGWLRLRLQPPASGDAAAFDISWRDEVQRIARQPFPAGGLAGHRH